MTKLNNSRNLSEKIDLLKLELFQNRTIKYNPEYYFEQLNLLKASSIKERSGINIILKEEQENKYSIKNLILQSNIGYLDDKIFRNRYNADENIGIDYSNCDIKYELISFDEENKIISVFSRLHPLINNNDFFLNFGTIENINKTVYVDLRLTLEEQKKQYRKSNKSELNQLRRKNYVVEEAQSEDEINEFISIYPN